jgi:trk system potassium uptake protein TrkH
MKFSVILRILGLLLVFYSLSMLPPMAVSLIYDDDFLPAFVIPFLLMSGGGLGLWFSSRQPIRELQLRDGFIITVIFWVALSLISALPFLFEENITLHQAVFEAVSGFTTTGATAFAHLESFPKSLLYYRQQLQFLGGLGVIVLAIAVLPILGIGGMQLYRAEAPGPMRDDKLTPRLAHTAKALVYVYVGLNALCALAYHLAGMNWFDAIGHSFTTVSTSGFSPYDTSLGYFAAYPWVDIVAIVFMLLGSLNFAVHYLALHRFNFSFQHYWKDTQTRVFLGMTAVLVMIIALTLFLHGTYDSFLTSLRHAAFQLVSLMTTTGYTTQDYILWPVFLPVLVFGSGFIGGCVGGTTGGIKIMRIILLYKQGAREILRLIHPNAVIPIRIGTTPVSTTVAEAVWGFAFLYMASLLVSGMLMMAVDSQMDILTAFAAASTCLNLMGPGLGDVASNFSKVSDGALWLGSFTMLLGRLEILSVLVLFSPAFWYR